MVLGNDRFKTDYAAERYAYITISLTTYRGTWGIQGAELAEFEYAFKNFQGVIAENTIRHKRANNGRKNVCKPKLCDRLSKFFNHNTKKIFFFFGLYRGFEAL